MRDYKEFERSIIKTYRKPIWRKFIEGIQAYELIQEGDRIAVCISGGKDSMLLAKLLQELQRHGQMHYSLEFMVMDPGYNPANRKKIIENAHTLNIPIKIFDSDIFDVVVDVENNPCYLCARMRRGFLYQHAKELGCNKIALGHHFDDVIETIVMGMMYGAQIQTMMPKLHSTNFEGMELIRPMYMIREDDIIKWAQANSLEFLQCACRFTEEYSHAEDGIGTSKRQETKQLLRQLREVSPHIDMNIFRSVHNINLNTIIGYHNDTMKYNFLDDYNQKDEECNKL